MKSPNQVDFPGFYHLNVKKISEIRNILYDPFPVLGVHFYFLSLLF
jgi:hypothetical protein